MAFAHIWFVISDIDKPFTVPEIMDNIHTNIEFLSACHTGAAGYEEMPDEAIHLEAGLEFLEFKSVIGTP
ncbi:uncharacterized protein HD556DRAFT_1354663 [Suillus plorans]|uniref:Uncharacterized protein n=1 Tax=Suillus plorans TaxID=116603 RepID=A0A9P7IZ99_9AGAM|nr:uncharacterized protein HD556DRAFT_1354663 [Suillus plorans]KAG1797701.1 hypothetical protein HD556DRAFT_1354663 [Suillus plorans]